MPLLGREKRCSPRYRRSDDEFVVFLQGIPAHCRWQELKDLVRQTALHIRQAVVYDDSHGFPTGLGQIIVKNEDEAWRTYHRLSTNGWDGRSLVVTLAHTSAPTKPIAGPTRSPSAVMPGYTSGHSTPPRSQGNMTVPPSPISPVSFSSASPTYAYPEQGNMMNPMAMPQLLPPMLPDSLAQSMQNYSPCPITHRPMYEGPGWNVKPMYPILPAQPPRNFENNFHHFQPQKQQFDPIDPHLSVEPRRRVISGGVADLHIDIDHSARLQQGANLSAQFNPRDQADAREYPVEPNCPKFTPRPEEYKQSTREFYPMPPTDIRVSAESYQRPRWAQKGTWKGTTGAGKCTELHGQFLGEPPHGIEHSTDNHDQTKMVPSDQPLVVDGSRLQKRPAEWLSISVPS